MRKTGVWTFLAALLVFGAVPFANAAPVETPQTSVELRSEFEAATPSGEQWLGLHFKPKAGWHVYWKNPGDSGLAPKAEFSSLPNGSKFGSVEFPTPEKMPYGPLMNYAYEGEVLYPIRWTAPDSIQSGENITLTASVKWLVCKEECVPGRANLTLVLPVETKDKLATIGGTHTKLFKDTISSLPRRVDEHVKVSQVKDVFEVTYLGPIRKNAAEHIYFFSEEGTGIAAMAKQTLTVVPGGVKISVVRTPPVGQKPGEVRGILKIDEHQSVAVGPEVVSAQGSTSVTSSLPPANPSGLAVMLIFAFIGGIILNLMPCILPVLSIKVVEIAAQSGTNPKAIRRHGLIFTLGVMVSFWTLAVILLTLRAGGTTLGWGFQLQSPLFISALAILFFLMAMNLFGFFEVGDRLMGVGGDLAKKEGYVGSFFTGVLTTVAATPCSAPFMGTALGFALTQGAFQAFLVLSVLGFGLAFPYLVFSFLPNVAKILPRPGMWMKTLKEFLAFPLLGTVVWLCGVLGNQTGIDGVVRLLTAMVLVVGVIWIYGHRADRTLSRFARTFLMAALAVFAFVALANLSDLQKERASQKLMVSSMVHEPWKPWSAVALSAALESKKTVIVNFTAEWCVTCKVNETVVFNRDVVKEAMRSDHVVALLGDWTNGDPAITDAMMKIGRNSVPVYLLYKNGNPEPKILPQILSVDGILNELR